MSELRFATRLNSFACRPDLEWPDLTGKPTVLQMVARAAKVDGLTDVDLNFPDHVAGRPAERAAEIGDLGLAINGLAMRYYSNPAFKLGAFTNPDPAVRREAIDLTRRGIDAVREMGCDLMTIWLGQDGFDYTFQADYATLWQYEIDGLREVCDHDPTCNISIEYKPNEPRAFALLSDCATTLIAIRDVDRRNLGVTLDLAHVLYANEQPAFAAALAARHSRVLGIHLNDGYGKRDDGLMVGSVHPLQTIELLRQLRHDGYRGALYFDTFPDTSGLDPVSECALNIATVRRMYCVVDRLDSDNQLADAVAQQNPVSVMAIVNELTFAAT